MNGHEKIKKTGLGAILIIIGFMSTSLLADESDDDFEELLFELCVNFTDIALNDNWTASSLNELNNMCNDVLEGGATPSSDYNSSSNIGSSGASGTSSSSSAQVQVDAIKDRIDELQDEDDAENGWGLLLAAQTGGGERLDTVNETGFDSELAGLVVGADYRFGDSLITGFTFGYTTDEASFDNNTGLLDTTSSSIAGYFTYLPGENSYIDGYVGLSTLEFGSRREINFTGSTTSPLPVPLTGTATGKYNGTQQMIGVSTGYDWYFDSFSIGPYLAVDYHKTEIDSYDEDGGANPTGLEFRYDDQAILSLTSSIGLNLSYNVSQSWGILLPTFSITMVHQSKDDSRSFGLQPAFVPDANTTPINETTLFTQTDIPDRDYILANLGIVAAYNDGTQIFANYEQLSSHDFLETWAVNIGLLMEF